MGVVAGNGLSLLRHGVDEVYDLLCKGVGFLTRMCFGIHANDGFGVRLAEVYPLVGEIDFYAVDVGNLFVLVDFLHALQQGKDIGGGIEIDAIFRDAVLGQTVAELRSLATQLGQMRQNERNTNQSVATGVGSGIDYTAVAFAADHGTGFFHFRHHIHLLKIASESGVV